MTPERPLDVRKTPSSRQHNDGKPGSFFKRLAPGNLTAAQQPHGAALTVRRTLLK
jgi:hypothetical protein